VLKLIQVALNTNLPVQLPERPSIGRAGRPIALLTNHFEMRMPSHLTLYRYDVEIVQGSGERKTVWTNGKGRGYYLEPHFCDPTMNWKNGILQMAPERDSRPLLRHLSPMGERHRSGPGRNGVRSTKESVYTQRSP